MVDFVVDLFNFVVGFFTAFIKLFGQGSFWVFLVIVGVVIGFNYLFKGGKK